MINLLFIHQSSELYGSDKTLLALVKNLDKSKFNPVVVLPSKGLLSNELQNEHIKFYTAPVLKLHRKMFNPLNIFMLFKEIRTSFIILNNLNKIFKFDFVYSNTLAVLSGFLFARYKNIKHIWHVHEIIQSPKIVSKIFMKLLSSSTNSKIVYNSRATKDFWNVNEKIKSKSLTIVNGVKLNPDTIDNKNEINDFFIKSDNEIFIGLVGRINSWKGHFALLNTFKELVKTNDNIKLIFVGSPAPNQELILDTLKKKINEYYLESKIIIIPYIKDIFQIWETIDIAVVPSLEPEPFGLVAVEAMLSKKPVIGFNHGGLSEIIINNETGLLVTPKNENALREAIQFLIDHPEKRIEFGNKGYQRAINEFSENVYVENFEKLFSNLASK